MPINIRLGKTPKPAPQTSIDARRLSQQREIQDRIQETKKEREDRLAQRRQQIQATSDDIDSLLGMAEKAHEMGRAVQISRIQDICVRWARLPESSSRKKRLAEYLYENGVRIQ